MSSPSYLKGYRFEKAIQAVLETLGVVRRAHQSGAYTGEADLRWSYKGGQFLDCSCKIREKPIKFIENELADHDLFFFRSDRNVAKVALDVGLFAELLGRAEAEDHSALVGDDAA